MKFTLETKDKEAAFLTEASRGFGVYVCLSEADRESERSDAGTLHLLDNPICSVINHTHYWSGDGSALIKAFTSLLRAFMHTRTQNMSRPIFSSSRSTLTSRQPEMRGEFVCQMGWGVWKQHLSKHTE